MSEGGSIYGPFLIGTVINCVLYGVTVVQCDLYFQSCKGDQWWMKVFVLYLMVLETLNTIFTIGVVYDPLIMRYGSPEVLTHVPLMLMTCPITTVMISVPTHIFVAWRVKVVTKSFVLFAVLSFFSITALVGGITTSALFFCIGFQYSRLREIDGAVITWLASSAAADVIITVSLVYSLMRRRTGFAVTDDKINRIIRMTVQTGFLTSVFALIDVVLFILLEPKMWNFVWGFSLAKLYSNTLLSTLNARGDWKYGTSPQSNLLLLNSESAESRPQIEAVAIKTLDLRSSGYHRERPRIEINVTQECTVTV